MSRPLRIEYPGALYHVTVRGNRKAPIFHSDSDRLLFLEKLDKIVITHNWILHAYCLMTNHYHLDIETPDGNLSAGMKDLNGEFSQTLNRRNGTSGSLFEGRFKSFLIERDSYFLEVARYIVLNPVRAGMVGDPGRWPWSSYSATAGLAPKPDWLTIEFVLSMFAKDRVTAMRAYQAFVSAGIGSSSPFEQVRDGFIIGSDQFAQSIFALSDTAHDKEIPRKERLVGRMSLENVFSSATDSETRNKAIILARISYGYQVNEIASYLGLSKSTISLIIKTGNWRPDPN